MEKKTDNEVINNTKKINWPRPADLSCYIDEKGSECLNCSDEHPFDNALHVNGRFLESDCDEQLVMVVGFTSDVKLTSLRIHGPEDSGPKTVKIFINQSRALDFDTAENMEPVQTLTLTKDDLLVSSVIPLKLVKFQNVKNITLFVKDNQTDTETTKINYISFIGSPLHTTKMGDFKKISVE